MLESRSPLQHRFDDDNERRQPAFAAAFEGDFFLTVKSIPLRERVRILRKR
jgi:hypothetical protein